MEKSGLYFDFAEQENYISSLGHNHNGIEIYYLQKGVCNYFIDGEPYTISEGYTIVVPDGVLHRTTYGSKRHSRYLLNVSRALIPSSVLEEVAKVGYTFDTRDDPLPKQLFDKIAEEYALGSNISAPLIICYATELLAYLARYKSDGTVKRDESIVGYTVKRIRDGYTKEMSLGTIARELQVSPEHLCRRFKAETGFGFNEYLTLVRLQHAEHMLRNEPGRCVAEIAFAAGFNDSNYFSKRFKQMYGVSPLKIKKQR